MACFIATFAFYLSFPLVDTYTWVFTLRGIGLILAAALAGSLVYWWTSQVGARGRRPFDKLRAGKRRPYAPRVTDAVPGQRPLHALTDAKRSKERNSHMKADSPAGAP